MKKVFRMILALAVVLALIPLAAHADTSKEGVDAKGFAYTIEGDTATITGYTRDEPANSIVIPATVEGKPVTAIADGFVNTMKYTVVGTLKLPDTITYIGAHAFDGCGFLGELTLPSGLKTLGEYAFANNAFSGDLKIPGSVEKVGGGAFMQCGSFRGELTISSGVTEIGGSAFDGAHFEGSLTIPSSVKTIGDYAFQGNSFSSLALSSGLESIGRFAFSECSFITGDLLIPQTVTSIGDYAFNNCGSFDGRLELPSGLTKIKTCTFLNCGFTGSLTIPPNVVAIDKMAFEGCAGFTGELILPSKVAYIGDWAFCECKGFTADLTIPSSVRTIGQGAFYNCEGLTGELTILPGVEYIGASAFSSSGFTGSLVIPSSVKIISRLAFDCLGFTGTVVVPASAEAVHFEAFSMNVKVKMASKKTFVHDDKTALAIPKTIKILLNGKEFAIDSYVVDNIHCVRLEDLATMFNTTDYCFDFSWNAKKKEVKLDRNAPYKKANGKMTKSDGKSKKTTYSRIKVEVDGIGDSIGVYKISGNNYFRLNDIMEKLAFNVDNDDEMQTFVLVPNFYLD